MTRKGIFITGVLLVTAMCFSIAGAQPYEKKIIKSSPDQKLELYAPAVQFGKTVYVSGRGDGRPSSPDEGYGEKTRRCLNGIRETLQLAGLDMENVVKTWVMLEDLDQLPELSKAYREFFPENAPARTTFGVANIPGPSQIEITTIAYTDLSDRKIIGPPDKLYSLGILAGNTLYVSGRGSAKPEGGQPDTFESQARQAMKNMEAALNEAGLDFRHVVWSNVYIDNYDNYGIVNKVYSEFFEYGNEPARVTVFVDTIPGGNHIEVTCIATTDLSSRKVVRPASMTYGPEEMSMTRSPGVWAGDTLYLSYQTGYVPGEGITTVDLEKQFRQMAQNHIDVLTEAGLTTSDIAWGHVFLRNINDYGPMNEIFKDYFTSPPGVRTCFQPNHGYEKNDIRLRSAFIAVRSKK